MLGLLAVAFSLLILEVLARYLPDAAVSVRAHRIPHRVLGWSLEPGATFTYAAAGPRVAVTYNSKGWRDVEHDRAKPDGTYRLLILGDSFMEAFSVPLGSTMARRLEAELVRAGRDAEVINFGVGGYGTLQQWLAFTTEGVAYGPDLVLLGFYTYNDVLDNSLVLMRGTFSDTNVNVRSRPFLDPSSPAWRVIPPDYEGTQQAFDEARGDPASKLPGPLRYVSGSALYRRLRDARRSFAARREMSSPPDADVGPRSLPGVYRCEETPEWIEAWQLTDRILARLAADVRASGADLVVFSVPSHVEVDVPDGPEARCLANPRSRTRLAAILSTHGVRNIDLLPAFARAQRDGVPLFGSDLHWTEVGHALAARVIAEALR